MNNANENDKTAFKMLLGGHELVGALKVQRFIDEVRKQHVRNIGVAVAVLDPMNIALEKILRAVTENKHDSVIWEDVAHEIAEGLSQKADQ